MPPSIFGPGLASYRKPKPAQALPRTISYFLGLDALRFFAAYLVVLHHAEQIRRKAGLAHLKDYSLFNNGGLAVSFFFVLSGFLITYLLLREQAQTGRIHIKAFYMRRVLRIWPLYYLLVLLGLVVVPALGQMGLVAYSLPFAAGEVWYYYVFFAPFLVNLLYPATFLDPLWSIGVEELFYLFWAPLVRLFGGWLPQMCLAVVATKVAWLLAAPPGFWLELARSLQFEAMAIGALAAWWLYHREVPLAQLYVFRPAGQMLLMALVLARIGLHGWLVGNSSAYAAFAANAWGQPLVLSALFAWLILNVSANPATLMPLRNGVLAYLGRISYGIYMYHMLVVFVLVQVGKKYLAALPAGVGSIVFYAVASAGVVGVAALSKRVLEDPILRLRKYWA